ncbi:MAG: hypothetical protein J6N19_04965 [Clostridium sp.]|nr:hypothetical protein [Clostridium sp.]
MTDREFVIRGLNILKVNLPNIIKYDDLVQAAIGYVDDALVLLKEQEAEPGHWIVLENQPNAGVYCSECNTKIFDHYPMKKKYSYFCPHCGTRMEGEAVKCELKNTSLKP